MRLITRRRRQNVIYIGILDFLFLYFSKSQYLKITSVLIVYIRILVITSYTRYKNNQGKIVELNNEL